MDFHAKLSIKIEFVLKTTFFVSTHADEPADF